MCTRVQCLTKIAISTIPSSLLQCIGWRRFAADWALVAKAQVVLGVEIAHLWKLGRRSPGMMRRKRLVQVRYKNKKPAIYEHEVCAEFLML
jgi:hypothetical protein